MLELKKYNSRPVSVDAIQLTNENVPEIAERCGGSYNYDETTQLFVCIVPTGRGTIYAVPGMWLVHNGKSFVAMTNENFNRKFELVNDKGERVPPYSRLSETK